MTKNRRHSRWIDVTKRMRNSKTPPSAISQSRKQETERQNESLQRKTPPRCVMSTEAKNTNAMKTNLGFGEDSCNQLRVVTLTRTTPLDTQLGCAECIV